MPNRTIAIGDIHGCIIALDALLEAIDPQESDLIIPLGDYVDRGPDSRSVIDRLIELSGRCRLVPLLGNHELMLLAARDDPDERDFWCVFGGAETLGSYDGDLDGIPEAHIEFITGCRRFFETSDHLFLHAGYAASLPLAEQPDGLLLWEHLSDPPPEPHCSGKTAVVGHTPQMDGEILDMGHLICIDTFCFGGGWLTALDVQSGQAWQADGLGKMRA